MEGRVFKTISAENSLSFRIDAALIENNLELTILQEDQAWTSSVKDENCL